MSDTLPAGRQYAEKRGLTCILVALAGLAFTGFSLVRFAAGDRQMITIVMCVCWLIGPLVYLFTSPLGWPTSWRRFGLGSWRQFNARERALLNDELAQAHRHTAVAVAFCIGLAGLAAGSLSVFGLFVLPAWWPIALISLSGSAGAFAFGLLDLRSKGEAE